MRLDSYLFPALPNQLNETAMKSQETSNILCLWFKLLFVGL